MVLRDIFWFSVSLLSSSSLREELNRGGVKVRPAEVRARSATESDDTYGFLEDRLRSVSL